jgi:hypothetical protein
MTSIFKVGIWGRDVNKKICGEVKPKFGNFKKGFGLLL